jgi:hypothetical protein
MKDALEGMLRWTTSTCSRGWGKPMTLTWSFGTTGLKSGTKPSAMVCTNLARLIREERSIRRTFNLMNCPSGDG